MKSSSHRLGPIMLAWLLAGCLGEGILARPSRAATGIVLTAAEAGLPKGVPAWIAAGALAATANPSSESCPLCFGFGFFASSEAVYDNLAALDAKPDGRIRFEILTRNQAASIGLTERERSAYERHLGELNALTAQVTSGFIEAVRAGRNPSVELASMLWIRHAAELDSPETLAAARKILSRFVEELLAKRRG